jgi:hypothetical protein
MLVLKERFLTGDKGSRVAFILDVADGEKLLEELEEPESIRAGGTAKGRRDELLPFEQPDAGKGKTGTTGLGKSTP